MLADIVALGSDPEHSIRAVQDIRGVVAAGMWHADREIGGRSSAERGIRPCHCCAAFANELIEQSPVCARI